MWRSSFLDREAQYLKGVGPRRAKLLERLGLKTARDLLYHTPRRYEDASTITPAKRIDTGMDVTVVGQVVSKGVLPTRKGLRIFQAVIRDSTASVECAWPGQPFLDRVIERGDYLLVSGPVRFFHGRQIHPREFTILAGADEAPFVAEGKVFPIYPATEGLAHRQIRHSVAASLEDALVDVERHPHGALAVPARALARELDEPLRVVLGPELDLPPVLAPPGHPVGGSVDVAEHVAGRVSRHSLLLS